MHAAAPTVSLFRLPNPSSTGHSSRGPRAAPRARPLIFVAEDDAELRGMLCEALRAAGYDVLSASTGHDMLKLLTAASRAELAVPDALVMDVRMPQCSGLDVLTALRLAEWQQPVVMMTAFGDPSAHERATRRGASFSLDKPVDTDDLVEIIDFLLRNRNEAALDTSPVPHDEDQAAPDTVRCPL